MSCGSITAQRIAAMIGEKNNPPVTHADYYLIRITIPGDIWLQSTIVYYYLKHMLCHTKDHYFKDMSSKDKVF